MNGVELGRFQFFTILALFEGKVLGFERFTLKMTSFWSGIPGITRLQTQKISHTNPTIFAYKPKNSL